MATRRPLLKAMLRGLCPTSGTPEPRYFDFIFPLIVLLMYGGPVIAHHTPGDSSDVRAFAVIDGRKQTVQVGDVVAQGTLVDDGTHQYCDFPPTTYGLSGVSDGSATLSMQVTKDCQLVVREISQTASGPAGARCGLEVMGVKILKPHDQDCPWNIWGVTQGP